MPQQARPAPGRVADLADQARQYPPSPGCGARPRSGPCTGSGTRLSVEACKDPAARDGAIRRTVEQHLLAVVDDTCRRLMNQQLAVREFATASPAGSATAAGTRSAGRTTKARRTSLPRCGTRATWMPPSPGSAPRGARRQGRGRGRLSPLKDRHINFLGRPMPGWPRLELSARPYIRPPIGGHCGGLPGRIRVQRGRAPIR